MKNAGLEKLIWVLIYAGLLAAFVGVFVIRGGAGFGWAFVIGGAALAAVGAVLVWVRSRRAGDGPPAK